MTINIASGECLKEILEKKHNDTFIPFNEAMIKGEYHSKLFSDEFIIERANTHNVSKEEYKSKLSAFLNLLDNIEKYDAINLYFGDEPFCLANKKAVINAIQEYGFKGIINSCIVDENTGDILSSEIITIKKSLEV